MICRSVFIVVLVLGTAPALAHNPPPRMAVVSRTVTVSVNEADDITFKPVSAGGPFRGTRIQQIVQDEQGFLWFGTVDGLLRYDGYGYKRFDRDPDRRNSLGGVYVRSMIKDRAGILWIGCDQFLDRFDPRTQTFTHYRVEPDEPEGLALTVSHISEDHAGLLWLSTGNGLYRFAPSTGTFTRFAHDPDDPASLGGNDVKSSGEDRSGSFWVAAGEGLDLFDRNTGKVTTRVPLQEQRRIGFYEDSRHVFWIFSTSGRGLAVLDRERNLLTRYVLEGPTISPSGPPGVSAVLEDSEGTLWFGTGNAGLFKFDREHGGRFIQYRNDRDDSQSLPANTVVPQSLLEDREGHIWVALEGALPTVFARRPSSFQRLRAGPEGGSTVTSIFEDGQGTLWIGYLGALLGFGASNDRVTPYDPERRQTFGSVQAMAEDHEGGLWAGTTRGLSRVDRRRRVLTTFHHDPQRPESLSSDRIGALLVDRDGVLWITTDVGIDRYDPATNRFTTYRALPDGGDLRQYFGMREDGDGALWLASNYAGVQRFDPATSTFTVFLHNDSQPGSLSNNRVNSIHIDHAGTIWVGTQNGLNRFDPDRKAFSAYYEKDGLSGSVVNCILEDARGELWVSTNGGLTAFNPPTHRFRNFSVSEGLPSSDLTAWKPCFKARDGRMYFAGFSGAIAFYPDKIVTGSVVPSIAMTDFRVSGVPINVLPTTAGSSSTPGAPVTLGYRQNTIGFEFSALSFFSPNTHRYRYRLEGIDADWNEVDSTRRSVSYATLPPGTYVFRAQAAATPGVWGEPGVSMPIHILSPWWRAPWFIALIVFASGAAIWGGHRVQLRIVQRHEREITALNERLMKAQEQERIRIAGELHDDVMQQMLAVTMKLGTAKRRVASDSEARPLLDNVQEQLVAIGSDIRQLSHDLHPPNLQESGLPGALRGYCEQFSAASNIPVSCEADDTVGDLSRGVALALFRIAQEALGNAAKHSNATRILVRLGRSSRLVTLAISDNGQGFDASSLGASGGLGLIMMRERAAQLNGTFDFESAPNRGTTITVVVPFR